MASKESHIAFGCPNCGQKGEVVWSGDNGSRSILRLSNGFHLEDGRLPGTRHVIICNACDEIDPPRTAPLHIGADFKPHS